MPGSRRQARHTSDAPPDNDFRHLDEAVNLVERTGRRIVTEQADIRDFQRWPPGMRFGHGK
jgi:hypothetical protein